MRRTITAALSLAMVLALAVGAGAAWASGGWRETPGNPHNLPSYSYAAPGFGTGTARGPNLKDHVPVLISCRVRGQAVSDGDVWWYRIAAKPWDNHYYVSADDFYNDGRTTGSLKGTPYYDPKVPVC